MTRFTPNEKVFRISSSGLRSLCKAPLGTQMLWCFGRKSSAEFIGTDSKTASRRAQKTNFVLISSTLIPCLQWRPVLKDGETLLSFQLSCSYNLQRFFRDELKWIKWEVHPILLNSLHRIQFFELLFSSHVDSRFSPDSETDSIPALPFSNLCEINRNNRVSGLTPLFAFSIQFFVEPDSESLVFSCSSALSNWWKSLPQF